MTITAGQPEIAIHLLPGPLPPLLLLALMEEVKVVKLRESWTH